MTKNESLSKKEENAILYVRDQKRTESEDERYTCPHYSNHLF